MDKTTTNPYSTHIHELTIKDKKYKYVNLPSLKDPRLSNKLFNKYS